ncbi:hypothetical protein San01_15080 [Streptomyces angustmyceticus]|uniref:Uncharacterized protein n=1 Tax=Streptomyces angustmyceticus TaxID=285578 RepID=A0A5J4LB01_9ACTN|nr:hypothetical protein San01_15080 [Streptomyces angustmyceticus]
MVKVALQATAASAIAMIFRTVSSPAGKLGFPREARIGFARSFPIVHAHPGEISPGGPTGTHPRHQGNPSATAPARVHNRPGPS